MRDEIELVHAWRFQPDPADEGERMGYWRGDYDTSRWPETSVPNSFDAILPELMGYEGKGWYRTEFTVADEWAARRVVLRFEGANYRTRVWLNGVLLGENPDGFLPFEFPVHAHLRTGAPNVLAVRVDSTRRDGEVPGKQRGWRPFGGILRDVSLLGTDLSYIADVHVYAEPTDGGGRLVARVEVANERDSDEKAEVELVVSDSGGAEVGRTGSGAFALSAGGGTTRELAATANGVAPWSPTSPVLYTAEATLRVGGRETDRARVRFGFRTIAADGAKLLLNGEPIVLRGFNRHEDSPARGMCTDLETARQDFLAMKEVGANFVRLAHYPHSPGELDLCDELGLLVMDEIPLYWWQGNGEGEENCARKLEAARRQLRRMILRDRNHPCVIFWSVSNENAEERPEVRDGNAVLVRDAHELDPTRPAVHVCHRWTDTDCFAEDDVLCVNSYPSWSRRLRAGDEEYDFSDSTRFWQEHLADLHGRYPDRPILVSEFGYVSVPGVRDGALGEETHARVLAAEFAGMGAEYVCGTVVWCWADHAWPEEDFVKGMTTSPYGVVSRNRQPLRPLKTVKELFSAAEKKA